MAGLVTIERLNEKSESFKRLLQEDG